VAVAELGPPVRTQCFDAVEQAVAAFKLDDMALTVIEAEHFDARKTLQRPGEAGGGILPARKQHQCGFGLEWVAHAVPLAFLRAYANRWK
jgi:hypothetical protein